MAHPKEQKRMRGSLYHLEDQNLTLPEAKALKKHLIKTEEKKAVITHNKDGHKVWWAK